MRDRLRAFFEGRALDPAPVIDVLEEPSMVLVELHPSAQPLVFEIGAERLLARANTSTAGPGFHRHVCGLLRALADALELEWSEREDAYHYFDGEDPAALEAAFDELMADAQAQMRELAQDGLRGFALGLPETHVFEHEGLLASPLGPRGTEWLELSPREAGRDVLPFCGDYADAGYFRGLALTEMWMSVRWRAPVDEREQALLERVVTYVERAHGLDPSVPLPWAEQSAILTLLSEESLRATRAHLKAQSLPAAAIGYRRRPVRVMLSGGWRMQIDGAMAERWEERGTWVAWDADRSLWFSSLEVFDDGGAPLESAEETLSRLPPLEGDEHLALSGEQITGAAVFVETEVDDKPVHRLDAHAAVGHRAAVGTLVFTRPADREWALQTWGSLTRSG